MAGKFLIVGLGNPGKKYARTRHNVGYMVVDKLARSVKASFVREHVHYWAASAEDQLYTMILMKPATFMNLSGLAVAVGRRRYGLEPRQMLVICDDLNLPWGTLRLRAAGSDGGHKGLQSIIASLETQEFPRLRIGIGNPMASAVDFVLAPFTSEEQSQMPELIQAAAAAVESFVKDGIEIAMSRFNKNYLS
ncbi:MAG: aminoacyl-tRNA hydrolase [candidate division KSB1 bacterium]|nr:aminoacyl-tRNA hydrolase [candidate division KSB1 bacterium]MDZ7318376.1 aminoacyl-tRNA hydrolase [candidate division KSB1 bacterium]MDZ7341011.1 aminoacyl-tRNA hydrolase [candidate division KSB1 bacterium]